MRPFCPEKSLQAMFLFHSKKLLKEGFFLILFLHYSIRLYNFYAGDIVWGLIFTRWSSVSSTEKELVIQHRCWDGEFGT